jgi:hypothetical protein
MQAAERPGSSTSRAQAPVVISVTRAADQIEVSVLGWRKARSSFFTDQHQAMRFAVEMARISRSHLFINLSRGAHD